MRGPTQVQAAFRAAGDFLDPVLQKEKITQSKSASLLENLKGDLDPSTHNDEDLSFCFPVENTSPVQSPVHEFEDEALEDAKRRRILHGLLDLISLEGIYPSLSSGVGIPLQQRVISVLPAGIIAKQGPLPNSARPRNESLLRRIITVLMGIILDERPSIQPIIRGRVLSDVISGAADLSFNPQSTPSKDRDALRKQLSAVMDGTPSVMLLPTLSNFLQADPVIWFRVTVSSHLARIPLRPQGVRQTIMFIASQIGPSLGQEARDEPSNGPHFTLQAIMQISRLLGSVPQGMDANRFFATIGPQLLALLDGEDPDLKKTASYAIGNGILNKRAFGAPKTIGHSIFVEPIYGVLTAQLTDGCMKWLQRFSDDGHATPIQDKIPESSDILVASPLVDLALERLASLVLQHPNPGLAKRLLHPVLRPLWSIACFADEQKLSKLYEKSFSLLQSFFWDLHWTYQVDSGGNSISITKRHPTSNDQSNIIRLVDSLQGRTDLFVKLLESDPNTEETTGDIFLYVSQTWLVKSPDDAKKPETIGDTENVMQKLVSATIAKKLLENFKDTLSRRPLRILELIGQVIDGERQSLSREAENRRSKESRAPSLTTLGSIVPESNADENASPETETSESLSVAFSLLSTVLASPDFAITPETKPNLESTKANLDQLIPLLPDTLQKPATTSSMLLEIQLVSPENEGTKLPPQSISDLETHRQALANLNSELPPVQAEGFSLLSKLVANSSPVLDIPSTLTLLLSIITDISESTANDEFVYLNAIKLIGTLASRHPRTVVKTLVDSYADKSERRTLDQRLKIGESILRTVQDLGTALAGDTAKILGEGMIAVAGRRGKKPEAQKTRKQKEEKERRQKEREERQRKRCSFARMEGLVGPSEPKPAIALEEGDSETETPEQTAHAANIIEAWAAGSFNDDEPDDLRVRASALSILASAAQTNIIGLGPALVSSALDLALATITIEQAPESAILRRASVVLILDVLKAIVAAQEARHGGDIGFGFSLSNDGAKGNASVGNIPAMIQTLGIAESKETDTIVRGHLRALIESLEAWLENSLMNGFGARHGSDGTDEIRLELGDRIAGLDINPMAGKDGSSRPRIEEIE
ncbi:hypothetical protein N7470_003426 [Penicillium chermesinum]|nr:hypothetical protein N7470_003426 [Penicillium chermesinum]